MIVELYESNIENRLRTNDSIIEDYSTALQSLKESVSSIGNSWAGSDYDYFVDNITPFLKDLDELLQSLLTYHQFLKDYIEAVGALQESYQDRVIKLK